MILRYLPRPVWSPDTETPGRDPGAQSLVETAGDIMQSEIDAAHSTTAAVIETAAEAIDQAQADAARIAEAAMQTEIGRRVSSLETRGQECDVLISGLRSELSQTQAELSALREQTRAAATLAVTAVLDQQDQSLLTLPASSNPETLAEATDQVTELLPEALQNVEVESPAPVTPPPAKRHRFL